MATLVPRLYSNFRGVDFRGEEINLSRSPDSLNVWKDYKETDSIRTRPGMKLLRSFPAVIHGIYFYKGDMLVHSGTKIYKVSGDNQLEIFSDATNGVGNAFVYEDVWYFKDGKNYIRYDGTEVKAVVGYVPTTTMSRNPLGGGTKYEDVNMLSDKRINSFLANGVDYDYFLDVQTIDEDFVPVVKINGETVDPSKYEVIYGEGRIKFLTESPPEKPATVGQDNVTIEFKKAVPKYIQSILGCDLLQVFDNRVFFSGNKDFPNMIWHCSLNDPTYVSDLDYYREGMDSASVKGMVAGNNALWVFREPSDANTTVFYHNPTIDDEYGKIYPSSHSSITIGCTGKAINFNDDILFFSDRGMEGISGDITTEQVVAHRSSLVDRKMLKESGYENMILAEWQGYLFVFIGNKAYLADSRTMFQNENHVEYEWFYWEMEKEISQACVHNGILYLGAENAVYTLTDNEKDIECWWVTPKDKFGYGQKQKTTNKRGCVAEATGDISVYAKLEDTDFELIGNYEGVEDYFVSRIKRKKFKDLQLKFHSNKRFSLETVTIECFIGGYIKR